MKKIFIGLFGLLLCLPSNVSAIPPAYGVMVNGLPYTDIGTLLTATAAGWTNSGTGISAVLPVTVTGTTNDGSTNIFIGKDSGTATVFSVDTDGKITTPGIVNTITTHGATEGATAATMYGQTHRVTGAYTVTLPAAVVGMSATFRATTAAVMGLDSNASDAFVLAGTALTAGNKIVSSGVLGETVYIECSVANQWDVYPSGVFADGGA